MGRLVERGSPGRDGSCRCRAAEEQHGVALGDPAAAARRMYSPFWLRFGPGRRPLTVRKARARTGRRLGGRGQPRTASYPVDGTTVEALCAVADGAVYGEKRRGPAVAPSGGAEAWRGSRSPQASRLTM